MTKYDVKPFLELKMPGLLELLGTRNISWATINKNFGKYLKGIKSELLLTQQSVLREATFYNILMQKHLNTGVADGMFDWYRALFESLSANLTSFEKSLLHNSVYNLLVEQDKNYLNFIGELATLNEIKKQFKCDLISVEEPIQNENNYTADFLFSGKDGIINVLVEVVNLHFQETDIAKDENIRLRIESKLKNKIKVKFTNPRYEYLLQPVIWTKDLNDIKCLFDLYAETGLPINNVLAPFTYFTYKNIFGQYEHHFDRIY